MSEPSAKRQRLDAPVDKAQLLRAALLEAELAASKQPRSAARSPAPLEAAKLAAGQQRVVGHALPSSRLSAPGYDQGERDWLASGPAAEPATAEPSLPPRVAALTERPRIALSGRASKVPRVTRQAVLDRLLERELERREVAGEAGDSSAACAAAVLLESQLFDKSSGTAVYRNQAAQVFSAAAQAAAAQASHVPAGGRGAVAPELMPEEETNSLLERCLIFGSSSASYFATALDARRKSELLLWEVPFWFRKAESERARLLSLADDMADEEPAATGAADDPSPEELPPPPLPPPPQAAGPAPLESASEAVISAVRACASEWLSKFSGAPEATNAAILERVVARVCARHPGATDASFLVREAKRVHAFCESYLQHSSDKRRA
jgi:hypothetical protein